MKVSLVYSETVVLWNWMRIWTTKLCNQPQYYNVYNWLHVGIVLSVYLGLGVSCSVVSGCSPQR